MKPIVFLFAWILLHCSPLQAQQAADADQQKPLVLGHSVQLFSPELGENRVLNIYLPDGYREGDTTRYPVVYLLDGGMDEDFIHVVGLVQFNTFPWVHRMPPSIVVGIVNVDRRRDFTYPTSIGEDRKSYPSAGHSDRFIAFLERDLQPFVARRFHVNGSRTIIGESLGGLLATEILLKKPMLFQQYVIISPSLWWDNGSLLGLVSGSPLADGHVAVRAYIGVGKEGIWPAQVPHVMEVDANLLADKLAATKKAEVFFDYLPQESHATIAHPAIFNAFRWLYKAGL
jgi:uncharacterized protein